jgi:hypothetical protein
VYKCPWVLRESGKDLLRALVSGAVSWYTRSLDARTHAPTKVGVFRILAAYSQAAYWRVELWRGDKGSRARGVDCGGDPRWGGRTEKLHFSYKSLILLILIYQNHHPVFIQSHLSLHVTRPVSFHSVPFCHSLPLTSNNIGHPLADTSKDKIIIL